VHRVGDGHTPGRVLEYETDQGADAMLVSGGAAVAGGLVALAAGAAVGYDLGRAATAHRAMLVSEIEGVPRGGQGSAFGAARGRGRGREIADPSNGTLETLRGTVGTAATRAMGSPDEDARARRQATPPPRKRAHGASRARP